MKSNYLLLAFAVLVVVTGTYFIEANSENKDINPNNGQEYQTYSYLSNEMIENAQEQIFHAELNNEYTPEYMLEVSDNVVLASIISVDSADTKYSTIGNTYGKLVVNNTIYGNIKEGEIVEYFKSGGIMTLEEYDRYQFPEAREKHKRLQQESGIDPSTTYINTRLENDVNIEAGKVYLCYLKYSNVLKKYEIIGLGNGFREVNIKKSKSVYSVKLNLNNYEILNNNTGKYESLVNYISENINV